MSLNMKRNILREDIGKYLMLVAMVIFISVVGWYAQRWTMNYRAETAICEMVKPEALIDPSDCEQ